MMEENTRKLPVRFNLDKPDQKRAWEYLQTMDRSVFTSWNHVIHLALLDYFDRYYRIQEDPYLETREREERFVQQIVDAVCESHDWHNRHASCACSGGTEDSGSATLF